MDTYPRRSIVFYNIDCTFGQNVVPSNFDLFLFWRNTSLLKNWYFAILIVFWKSFEICVSFPVIYIIFFLNLHVWPGNEGANLQDYIHPIERGCGSNKVLFYSNQFPASETLCTYFTDEHFQGGHWYWYVLQCTSCTDLANVLQIVLIKGLFLAMYWYKMYWFFVMYW